MTFADIQHQAQAAWSEIDKPVRPLIIIGAGTCGVAAGANKVSEALRATLATYSIAADIMRVGCIGLCYAEPLVDIVKPGRPRICYGGITAERARELVVDYLLHDNPRPDLALGSIGGTVEGIPALFDLPMLKPQVRIVLRNCGFIDPDRIEHYIARDGYAGLGRALAMAPEAVIDELKRSGLRGRGGAGFPTGLKWEFCHKAPGAMKYLICNADEGDPGAFMDRSVLEGDPHAVLEGMIIAAYAIGCPEGYIYVRAEYPLAVQRLHAALRQAEEKGLLGDNILGSDFSFRVHIKEGAGAFVCGEETALIASIEGKRGMPRPRPPFPAQAGLWGKPTNVNNVETFANVPAILLHGGDWYASYGTEKSKGTKTFALAGKAERTGLIEVPMGITLGQVVFEIGGGIADGKQFKAAQTGGPIGGCIPAHLTDLPIDFESLTAVGALMGSGGLIVMDESTCMVDVARFFLAFAQNESCGKCVPCRLGTRRMLDILEDIVAGRGAMEDLARLEDLGQTIALGSLCALGAGSPNPVRSTLKYFREEYQAHIEDRRCPALVCKDLLHYRIIAEKCPGCGVCKRQCPADAISGERRKVHEIDPDKCSRCGACFTACRFEAIERS